MGAREALERRREAVEKLTRDFRVHGREIKGRDIGEREARKMAEDVAKRADKKDYEGRN